MNKTRFLRLHKHPHLEKILHDHDPSLAKNHVVIDAEVYWYLQNLIKWPVVEEINATRNPSTN